MKGRLFLVLSGVFLTYGALALNLYYLQVQKTEIYTKKAQAQFAGYLEPRRGNIFFTDKNGNLIPAAINKEYSVIYAVPKEIIDPVLTGKILSQILSLGAEKTINLLSKTNDLYELILPKATSEQAAAVIAEKIKGIYIGKQDLRFYPFGTLAAHVLGFVGESDKDSEMRGRYGVESYFDEDLRGTPGKIDAKNREKISEPIDGKDIILTIDRNIQARAEEILSNIVKKYQTKGGSVIVADPKTGKILALGNYPTFDPNNYADYPLKNFLNPVVEAIYEPGSIFKVLTMSAGIDSGKITPETKFNDTGTVTLNGRTIKNWDFEKGSHGWVTMTEVIENSINTGAVFAQRKTGTDIFYNYLRQFGVEEKTGIALPGELSGSLTPLKKDARDINFATASFGQGVSVTPIGLLRALAAIANDGTMTKPYIIEGVKPEEVRSIITKNTADQVTGMMISAVRKALIAQIPNYEIAGKTGTALVPNFKSGGYTENVIDTYMGFAPATNPRFIILIKIDEPAGAPHAAETVVPAFRELAEFILNYYNIPPDSLEK